MKITIKSFKTWDEQVEILNQLGNNFLAKNPAAKKKVLTYLKQHGFLTGVDFFAPLLWNNLKDGINNQNCKFMTGFQFNDLLQLSQFDQSLKFVIQDLLINIRERLKLGIVYYTFQCLATIYKHINKISFYLIDNLQAPIIAKTIFTNKFSKQSFFNEDYEFMFVKYYSFLAKSIDIFDISTLFIHNPKIQYFYTYRTITNSDKIKLINAFKQYITIAKNKDCNKVTLLENNTQNNQQIFSEFGEFFLWCKQYYRDLNKFNNKKHSKNLDLIDEMIEVLINVFTKSYEEYGEAPLGMLATFFYQLNEKIQLQIIKKQFPWFYQKISASINNKANCELIVISTFISFLDVFKKVERNVNGAQPIYCFYDFHQLGNSLPTSNKTIKGIDFWFTNQPTCNLLNNLLIARNNNFTSNYFKDQFISKNIDYYLTKFNNLGLQVYYQEKERKIYFTNKSNNLNSWHVPMFFLKDAIDWLIVFVQAKNSFGSIIAKCLQENIITNKEINNRLHDYLFNKIIISFEETKDNELD